jgi:hypothetical protein
LSAAVLKPAEFGKGRYGKNAKPNLPVAKKHNRSAINKNDREDMSQNDTQFPRPRHHSPDPFIGARSHCGKKQEHRHIENQSADHAQRKGSDEA